MSSGTNIVSGITGILTIGVGGMVAWVKKTLTATLDAAQTLREETNAEIIKIEADITAVQADLSKVLGAVTPAKATRRPTTTKATKAASAKKASNSIKKTTNR